MPTPFNTLLCEAERKLYETVLALRAAALLDRQKNAREIEEHISSLVAAQYAIRRLRFAAAQPDLPLGGA